MQVAGVTSSVCLHVCHAVYSHNHSWVYIVLGTFDESFDMNLGVGDLMLEDEEEKPVDGSGKKKTIGALPEIEGEESVADYLTKFKRACLSKKTQLRDLEDKLKEDQVRGHEPQVCNIKRQAWTLLYMSWIYIK